MEQEGLHSMQSKVQKSEVNWVEKCALILSVTTGVCTICGKLTLFIFTNRNLRESGKCLRCKSSNRQRQMMSIFIDTVAEVTGLQSTDCDSLMNTHANNTQLKKLKIYNTETVGALHNQLSKLPNYQASEYFGYKYKSGDIVHGVIHQDLMATSFDDESFDIILSSDVFEHVPDPYKGFSEVFRILRPGGRHIFTVPFYSDRFHDEVRAIVDADGSIENLMPPMYHRDPIRPEGIIVYVIFSWEMLDKLREIGYQVTVHNARDPAHGILGGGAIVFEAMKPVHSI